MFQVFGGIFLLIFMYVISQTVFADLGYVGSHGSVRADSLKAIELQNQFYQYFWNATPELKKTKQVIDETKQTIRDLKELKDKARESVNRFFHPDKINYIKNQLPQGFNTKDLEELARRYGSKIDWILKANGLKNKEDIKALDSLYIPKSAPKALPADDAEKPDEE